MPITVNDVNNAIFPTYIETLKYVKGDRLYLKPIEEDEQIVPSGTRINFMGKEITYSAETTFIEYPVRIRAKVDNARDPRKPGILGVDWVIDDPYSIIEEGSNINGSYLLYACGKGVCDMEKIRSGMNVNVSQGLWFPFPIKIVRGYPDRPEYLRPSGDQVIGDMIGISEQYCNLQNLDGINSSAMVSTTDRLNWKTRIHMNIEWY